MREYTITLYYTYRNEEIVRKFVNDLKGVFDPTGSGYGFFVKVTGSNDDYVLAMNLWKQNYITAFEIGA